MAGDELALLHQWGRPLSTQALVRTWLGGFLASGKAARIISLGNGGIAYEFARRDEDPPTEADIADALNPVWKVDAKSLIFVDAEQGVGQPGSLVECLGPLRAALETTTITGVVDAGLVEHHAREAVRVLA